MTKKIQLTQGQVAIVDDEDFEYLNQFNWYSQYDSHVDGFYAKKMNKTILGKRTSVAMHRLILDAKDGCMVDHKNGDTLDNTRNNLRVCTHAENMHNRRKQVGTNKYKGVVKNSNKWHARIYVDSKFIYLGSFFTQEDAAHRYDAAAEQYFGEFARKNY